MVSVPNNTVAFHAYLLGYHFQKPCTEYTFYMKNVNFGQQCTMFDFQAAVYAYSTRFFSVGNLPVTSLRET